MRAVVDGLRLLRSLLGVAGRYRAARWVGLLAVVGVIVFALGSGAYADECDPVTPTDAGCGTEAKPYVVKPPGTDPMPVEVTNPAEAASTIALDNDQYAALLGAAGFIVALQGASLFVQIGNR